MFAWYEDPIVCSWVGCGEETCGGTRRLSWPVVKLVNHHPRRPTSRHHPCDDPFQLIVIMLERLHNQVGVPHPNPHLKITNSCIVASLGG